MVALGLGGFAIGATEFVAMGLLPEIAQELLPALWEVDQESAIGRSGWVITAYAMGVVAGAPTIAPAVARYPRKAVLIGLAALFFVGNVASALVSTFELVVVARFITGLPHGAYFGIAALAAAQLLGPGKRGKAAAYVLAGLTISNVVGVPVITYVGQNSSWRMAYLLVAVLFAATTAAIAAFFPTQAGNPGATIRTEFRALARPAVWLALLTGSVGFGGFFAVYSYVAPLTTEVTGAPATMVPIALIALGLGMTAGNLAGGWMADRGPNRALFQLFGIFAASLIVLLVSVGSLPGLLVGLFLVGGGAAALSPVIQTRLMDVAGDSQTLAAALNHSALNLGNALGAFLGGLVIAAGWGYLAPTWLGLVLCVPGVLIALGGWAVTRRHTAPA